MPQNRGMGKKGFFILIILLLLFLLSNYMFIHTHLEHSYLMRNRKVFAEQTKRISLPKNKYSLVQQAFLMNH